MHSRNKLRLRGGRNTAFLLLFGQLVLHNGNQQLYTIFIEIKENVSPEQKKHLISNTKKLETEHSNSEEQTDEIQYPSPSYISLPSIF